MKSKNSDSLPILNYNHQKFTPKHLKVQKKRVLSTKKFVIREDVADKIEREKKIFAKPLKDVEQIMKKFD